MGSFNGMAAGGARFDRRATIAAPSDRHKLIRGIHAACRKLGLDDDARRDLQVGVTGKASMGDMDAGDLARVLDRLNRDSRPAADRPHIGKVRALWWSLYWLGAIDQPDARAIDAFVSRQTGVAALRFLDHRQAHSVVDALKAWCAREGVAWPTPPSLLGDRRAVAEAIWAKLPDPQAGGLVAWLAPLLGVAPEHVDRWAAYEWDAGIKALGKRLRKTSARP